ncbi:hypothetical protein GCM10027586_08260 [Kineococcus gypseus]|uniref:DUF4258 domain-containing protein n=1 Tax=Kineococcus gypseus TaxID=1637102 RepID=UPI003D7CA03E
MSRRRRRPARDAHRSAAAHEPARGIDGLSNHCRSRLRERGISHRELLEVLQEGTAQVLEDGRLVFSCTSSDVVAVVAIARWGGRTVLTAFRRRQAAGSGQRAWAW